MSANTFLIMLIRQFFSWCKSKYFSRCCVLSLNITWY